MFPELDRVLAAVLAARDTPAARRLVMDCRAVAVREGEAAARVLAEILLDGARALNAHESGLRVAVPGGVRKHTEAA